MVIQGYSAFDESMRFCGQSSGRQSPRRPNRASGWIEESDRLSQRGWVGGRPEMQSNTPYGEVTSKTHSNCNKDVEHACEKQGRCVLRWVGLGEAGESAESWSRMTGDA